MTLRNNFCNVRRTDTPLGWNGRAQGRPGASQESPGEGRERSGEASHEAALWGSLTCPKNLHRTFVFCKKFKDGNNVCAIWRADTALGQKDAQGASNVVPKRARGGRPAWRPYRYLTRGNRTVYFWNTYKK